MEKRRMTTISRRFGGRLAPYMRRGEPPSLLRHISSIVRTSEILTDWSQLYWLIMNHLWPVTSSTSVTPMKLPTLCNLNWPTRTHSKALQGRQADRLRTISVGAFNVDVLIVWASHRDPRTWLDWSWCSHSSHPCSKDIRSPDDLRRRVVEYVKRL